MRSLLCCLLLSMMNGNCFGLEEKRPNVIVIITDDQGYGDLGCHGNPILKTPHLDRLHRESVRFRDFHVSPTCAPTRAALMTGRHEFSSGVTHTIQERERLSLKSYTLATAMKGAGYATGIFGKWHLGDEEAYQPGQRGFEEVFIHGAGGIGQSYAGSCGDAPGNKYMDPYIRHNGVFEKTSGYCTDVFFEQAMKWMGSQKGKKPFFAWIATNAPHAPLVCPESYEAVYKDKVSANTAKFFGMIANIDENVGRLLEKLAEWQIEKDTLVIFLNDNGGTEGTKVHNSGMRGSKNTPFRGGTRGICFMRWPGTITPGDREQLTAHYDLFPTLAAISGSNVPEDVKSQWQGRDLMPILRDSKSAWQPRTIFTHIGRWEKGKVVDAKFANCSVRQQNFQMVSVTGKSKPNWQLFDLANDPGEKVDVASTHPDLIRKLQDSYDQWWESILPKLANEDVAIPKENAFKSAFLKQFGK